MQSRVSDDLMYLFDCQKQPCVSSLPPLNNLLLLQLHTYKGIRWILLSWLLGLHEFRKCLHRMLMGTRHSVIPRRSESVLVSGAAMYSL